MRWSVKVLAAAAVLSVGSSLGLAQYSDGTIKIGVMNDQSGLYADLTGQGSVWSAKKAYRGLLQDDDVPQQDRGGVRRPPEQTGYRLQCRAPVE